MKNKFTPLILFIAVTCYCLPGVHAQCSGAYTSAVLNWDNIDFLPSTGIRYVPFYSSVTFPYNQNFTLGTRTVNVAMAPADTNTIKLFGENGINTAHAGSLPLAAAGDDIQFTTMNTTASTITMTFDTAVLNMRFSVFDVDNNQRVTVTATNTAGTAQTVTIARANAASGITIGGTATAPAATGPGAGYNDNDNRGTINITIPDVKQLIITLSNAAGDIWLSDIGACVSGSFPINYQKISRPFTGQPQYVLTVVNNRIYYTDPTNGNSYFLFIEPGHDRLNSMAYDPYKRIVYYTFSLTDRVGLNPAVDKTLKKYDVDTKTISVVIPNVNTFGIPTYESGVESGAATFYNGALYLGIEGYTGENYAASRKSTIWKIDFDAAGRPIAPAAQVWGVLSDNGVQSQNIHDWSDFGITDGTLIDFDGSASGSIEYTKWNLMTGAGVGYTPVGPIPRQVSIGYDEKIYNVDAAISLYNNTNGVTNTFTMTSPLGPVVIPTGAAASWGDAAGPYRPFLDFGDAPATYDPDPWSPACHDTLTPNIPANPSGARTKLLLGPGEDLEWLKKGFTTVEDNFEDGLAFVPIFSPIINTYQAQVTVRNTTGSSANLCAWLDFNGNGLFDATEGITPISVPSVAGVQSFWLNWPSITSSLPTNSYTYLRIRITSSAMTVSNSTGYYSTGEVEDYRVLIDYTPLSIQMLSFHAEVVDNLKVKLTWEVNEEINLLNYEIERSLNGTEWIHMAFVEAEGMHAIGSHSYQVIDEHPYRGASLYRIRFNETSGRNNRYSNIQAIKITGLPFSVTLFPNPAHEKAKVTITAPAGGKEARIYLINEQGNVVASQRTILAAGVNTIDLPVHPLWPPGTYTVRVVTPEYNMYKRLVLHR